jgi:uncharacterized protein (TIGR03435 family)
MKTIAKATGFAILVMSGASAQTAPPLAFEVASIKPAAPVNVAAIESGTAHIGTKIDGARVDIGAATLFRLICLAYDVKPYQVTGPEWLKGATFDLQAKIPAGVREDKVPEMLQTLLAERFGLKIHHESKDQSVYALVVGKGGPKLKESAPEISPEPAPPPPPDPADKSRVQSVELPTAQGDVKLTRAAQGINIEMPGGEIRGKIRVSAPGSGGGGPPRFHVESSGMTMKGFADLLSMGVVDRPAVDVTGLTGSYEVAVDLSQEDAMNVARAAVSFLPIGKGGGDGPRALAGASDPPGSSIFTSVQNLGLKLEPRKMPLDMVVVDHAEKTPTAN